MANNVRIGNRGTKALSFASGADLLQRYHESIKSYGDKARGILARYSLGSDGVILGSNPFMNVQMGTLVQLATPAELEDAVRQNPNFFRNQYEDVGLVLKTNGDSYAPNDYVAKHLAQQVKKRLGFMPTPKKPVRVSLKGLSLAENENSENYGLVFMIGDEAEVVAVPQFNHKNHGRNFAETNKKGIPKFNAKGNRNFYTREQGLSGLYLDRNLNLRSVYVNLANSDSDGRVPLVSSEAGTQKNSGVMPYDLTELREAEKQYRGLIKFIQPEAVDKIGALLAKALKSF